MLHSIQAIFKKRFDNWIENRITLQRDNLTLNRKSIYILPTKFGILFGLILTAMLIGSINYEINLGFLLTFLFGAIFFTGMLQAYKNFNTIHLSPLPIQAIFADDTAAISFLSLAPKNACNIGIAIEKNFSHHNLEENTSLTLHIKYPKRGIHKINKIKLYSIYPMGHFYVWSWVKTELEVTVYPKPVFLPNIEQADRSNKAGDNSSQQKGLDELYSFKHYQQGDSINRMAWKKTAQTGKLHSKEMSKSINNDYYIDWHQFPNTTTEERLSFMCYLILQAHNRNEMYGLILPNIDIEPDNSEKHKHICLRELASFNQDEK